MGGNPPRLSALNCSGSSDSRWHLSADFQSKCDLYLQAQPGMETPLDVLSRAASLVHADDEKREAALRGESRMQTLPVASALSSHRTGPPPISPSKRKFSMEPGDEDLDCENDHVSKMSRMFNSHIMTGREFFSCFPELYPFLLKQLEAVASTVDSDLGQLDHHPSMFLLLLVLERLYPSLMDGTSSALSMVPFVPFIMSPTHLC
ncbi:uncharacterized protein LOC144373980 isoform X3 [Ictidomys tridecemlineatus]